MSRRYLCEGSMRAGRSFPRQGSTIVSHKMIALSPTCANSRQLPPRLIAAKSYSCIISTPTIFQSITLVVATTQHQHQHLLEDSSLRSQPKKQCGESVKVLTNAIGIYLGPQVDLIRRGIQSQMHSRFIALPKPMIHLNISQGVLLP